MARTETPAPAPGTPAPDFALMDPAGELWTLARCRGAQGTLVMFLCNHCPYVQAIVGRLVTTVQELAAHGIGAVAIMPNDVRTYPDDAPPQMAEFAARHGFGFPYLYDQTQAVARAYGAVCTPDFFGYDAALRLRYRGRLDGGHRQPVGAGPRELYHAMVAIAAGGDAPAAPLPSIGCSIKWREG